MTDDQRQNRRRSDGCMRCLACVILVALACEAASGQLERRGPEFEVASVKPSQPPTGGPFRVGTSGGPGSKDPTLWACENFSLSNLITMAYGIAHYQLSGPDWLGASMFDVTARVPSMKRKSPGRIRVSSFARTALSYEASERLAGLGVVHNGGIRAEKARKHLTPACEGLIRLVAHGGVPGQVQGRHAGRGKDEDRADAGALAAELERELVVPVPELPGLLARLKPRRPSRRCAACAR